MKMFRLFVVILATVLFASGAIAWRQGKAPSTFGKSVLNANFSNGDMFMNIVKSFGSLALSGAGSLAATLNADQYPVGTLGSSYGGNTTLKTGYFGRYRFKWTGTAAFNITNAVPTLVYSGGAGVFNVTPSNTGTYFGAPTFYNNATQTTDMDVEFAFGTLLTAAGTNGGNVQLATVSNGAFQFVAGTHVKFFTGVSANLLNGPNADGSWTVLTKDSNTQVTLANSSGIAGAVTITGSGGVGTQSEMIMDLTQTGPQVTFNFPTSVPGFGGITYAFSNFIWCKSADLPDILAGKQISQSVIDLITTIKPRYLRFMDMMTVQADYANYSQRSPITSMTFNGTRYDPTTYAGVSGGSGDDYTVSNPSGSPGGAYIDGEVIQFNANRTSVGAKPTINVGGRGVAPITTNTASQRQVPYTFPLSGTLTNGDVISVTFTASYLPSVAYVFQHTVNTALDTSLSVLQGRLSTELQADNVLAANGFIFGNSGVLQAYYVPALGSLDITSSTSGAGTEILTPRRVPVGGIVIGKDYTLTYVALMGGFRMSFDNSFALYSGSPLEIYWEMCTRANVGAWFTLPLSYTMTSTQSLAAAVASNLPGMPIVAEVSNEIWNTFAAPANVATVYSIGTGFAFGTDGAARLGMYAFYGLRSAQLLPAFATSYTGAGGSLSNLQTVIENWALDAESNSPSNNQMVPFKWNGGLLNPTPASCQITVSGATATFSGCTGAMGPGMVVNYSGAPANLKIVRPTSAPADTTRTGNGAYTLSASPGNVVSPIASTITNPVYSAVGGVSGSATSAVYDASPNRPIDLVDGVGYAVYFMGAQVQQGACSFGGNCSAGFPTSAGTPASRWTTIFQASEDYAQGVATANNTLIQAGLDAWSNDVRNGTLNSVIPANTTIASFLVGTGGANVGPIPGMEAAAALYDGARPIGKSNLTMLQYEGSLQQTLAGNNVNGTTFSLSPTDVNSQFAANHTANPANGWGSLDATYGYPSFGAGSSVTALNIVSLFLAYTTSTQYYNDQLYLWHQTAAVHAARPLFAPAQFGIGSAVTNTTAAIGVPLWGIVSGDSSSQLLANGQAQQYYNTNWLLKRDLNPTSNDNDPMWLEKAA